MSDLVPYNRKNSVISKKDDFPDFRSIIDSFFNGSFFSNLMPDFGPFKVDIKEAEKEYVIEAELPGVRKEDISLSLRDGLLTISVERNEQIDEERKNYIKKERRYGSYSRSFFVNGVKQSGVTAGYNNGVLTVTATKDSLDMGKDYKIKVTE